MKVLAAVLIFLSLGAFGQDQKYFFVFLNKKLNRAELPKEEVDKLMQGHMANIERLAKEGRLIVAGPFDGGGGNFSFKASSVEQTKEWISTDPGVKANRWDIEVLPYSPFVGGVCAAAAPYEMLTYEFVRYTKGAKYEGKDEAETDGKHTAYVQALAKDGNVVTAGTFGKEGGILILRGELKKESLEADPAIRELLYQPDYKKLYVAKGSFCEK